MRSKMGISLAMFAIVLTACSARCEEPPEPTVLLEGVRFKRSQVPPSKLILRNQYKSQVAHNDVREIVEFDSVNRLFSSSSWDVGITNDGSRTMYNGLDVFLYHGKSVSILNISAESTDSLYDPRLLGLSPPVWQATLANVFPLSRTSSITNLGREQVDGSYAWHVRMQLEDGSELDYWIDDQQGFRVFKNQERWRGGSRQIQSWFENAAFSWLPSRVMIEEFGANGALIDQQEITVVSVEPNNKQSEGAWTIERLNLPSGTRVRDARINRTLGYWDGMRIVPEFDWNHRADPQQGIPSHAKPVTIMLILMATLSAPIFFAIWRVRNKRKLDDR